MDERATLHLDLQELLDEHDIPRSQQPALIMGLIALFYKHLHNRRGPVE